MKNIPKRISTIASLCDKGEKLALLASVICEDEKLFSGFISDKTRSRISCITDTILSCRVTIEPSKVRKIVADKMKEERNASTIPTGKDSDCKSMDLENREIYPDDIDLEKVNWVRFVS